MRGDRQLEVAVGVRDHPLPEEGAPDLEHQLVIVLQPELEDPLERGQGAFALAQLEQRLAEPGQGVLVVGLQREGRLERAARPGEFLARQLRVRGADVQLDGVGVERETFGQEGEGFVVATFVVELMGMIVELVGATEAFRHAGALLEWCDSKIR